MKSENKIKERIEYLKTEPPARKFGWHDEESLLDSKIEALEWVLDNDK